jgi:hypothetical protein
MTGIQTPTPCIYNALYQLSQTHETKKNDIFMYKINKETHTQYKTTKLLLV